MIKPIRRSVSRAGSLKILQRRVAYLEDKTHKDHKDVTICRSLNYNCKGPKGKDFENQCVKTHNQYLASPERSRGGKPNKRLFEEFVYSTPEGAHLDEKERRNIEKLLVNSFAPHSAVRAGWHVNQSSGRCDLHLLFSSKNDDWPTGLTLASKFSNGKQNLISVINKVSEKIIQGFNKARPQKLKSAMTVNRERKAALYGKHPNLVEELAKLFISPNELSKGIKDLGYEITRENDKTISIKFPTSKRACRYNKADLIREMASFKVIEKGQPGGGGGGDGGGGAPPTAPPKPDKPSAPSQPAKPEPEPIPETKKPPKAWKPKIDWDAEAKKDKDKPS